MSLRHYNFFNLPSGPSNGDYVNLKVVYDGSGLYLLYGSDLIGDWTDITTGIYRPQTENITIMDNSNMSIGDAYVINGSATYTGTVGGNDIGNNGIIPSNGSTSLSIFATLPPKFSATIYVQLTFNGKSDSNGYIINKRDILNDSSTCFRGDSLVTILNKETNEEITKLAKDIVKGDIVKSTTRGYVPVIANLITRKTNIFYLLKKNIFGENMPSNDFYITYGHPIFLNGKEIVSGKIPEAIEIKIEPESIYSIMTEEREYIKINNLDVCTWKETEWKDYAQKSNILWFSK
jgi:hypothetical protein